MRHLISAAFLAAFAATKPLAGQAVQPSSSSPRSSVVIGVLIDSTTGEPLSAGRVELPALKRRVLTDAKGKFTIPDVRVGSDTLVITGLGYVSRRVPIEVRADTVRLGYLWVARNHRLDSLHVVAP